MNRQIGVGDSKNVIVFDPLLTGHVIRRMRSGRIRIFSGNQWETLYLINQGWSRDPPCTATVKVKRSEVKVTRSHEVSADKNAITRQCVHIPTSNLVGIINVGVDACGILSRSLGETNRK